MTSFPLDATDRLAEQIRQGKVTFFIGAGFSLDSEGNWADVLIGRLLVRFDVMTLFLIEKPFDLLQKAECKGLTVADVKQRAKDLRGSLSSTFEVEADKAGSILTKANAKLLASAYYNINDWMCTALGQIIKLYACLKKSNAILKKINNQENKRARACFEDEVGLPPIDLRVLCQLTPEEAGKALFLESMGFTNEAVMAGKPLACDIHDVITSYGERLLPRHHALARMAREGWCSTLVTTNYDKLIEGAYRIAGFLHEELTSKEQIDPDIQRLMPKLTYERFVRIARPDQFFQRGSAYRASLVIKLHGCVENYCNVYDGKGADQLRDYLPSMVFTYREIQNWREDAWSRDFLQTLLRTRTMAFCGYSGMDAVLHDTFRTVYEEMAAKIWKHDTPPVSDTQAPAFFFDIAGKKDFYATEILRAASKAVGVGTPSLIDHPNQIPFAIEKEGEKGFPDLDELMIWLYHRSLRLRQERVIERDLRGVVTTLMGHPPPRVELEKVIDRFHELVQWEKDTAMGWNTSPSPENRQAFVHLTSWTWHFHSAFLRELALGDVATCHREPGLPLHKLRAWPWYYPTLNRPDWCAWATLTEIALRRAIAVIRKESTLWQEATPACYAAEGAYPGVVFAEHEDIHTPNLLTIRWGDYRVATGGVVSGGAFRGKHQWFLSSVDLPWRGEGREDYPEDRGQPPSARELWQWAFCDSLGKADTDKLRTLFGVRHEATV